jgi:HD-GYP domain-containing protein (c-di-GMP phosphodiesterase class II)
MTTPRPYRHAMSQSAAIAELRRDVARGHMSRDLVEMFIAVLRGRQLGKTA